MPAKPRSRNWNDVQTAIATVAIVATLGLWNLFATPIKLESKAGPTSEPDLPSPTEAPVEAAPAVMPRGKIMFTQAAPQTTMVQQAQNNQQQQKKKKKDKNNNNDGGGSVTQTKTS